MSQHHVADRTWANEIRLISILTLAVMYQLFDQVQDP